MGEVWLGRHAVSNGSAAVKLLSPELARRSDALSLFAREQRALSRLDHPHIVPVFEVGERHFAMAYIEGASLARQLRAAIAPALALRVIRQIASALAEAHRRGVLHLDVKPSNILVDAAGNGFLADFGAALLLDEGAADPPLAGTPAYLAPERASGHVPGEAADQFALGRTLVAALLATERLPAWGHEVDALPEWIPAGVRDVVARAVAADPSRRFPSVAAFGEALAACDVEGIAPNVSQLAPSRDAAAYAWASQPVAATPVAPEIVRADYALDPIERAGAIAPERVAGFRERTGLRTTGFSLYGHTRSLGAAPGADWLARAQHVAILVHGYGMNRECWSEVAVALVRDNPDTVVAAFDHSGFGASAYAADPPAWEHAGYQAAGVAALAWAELVGLQSIPTVFIGHSLAATGLLLLPDAAFGGHRARILITPLFRSLLRGGRGGLPAWLVDVAAFVLRVLLTPPAFYRALISFVARNSATAAHMSEPLRDALVLQAQRLPLRTQIRLGAAMARLDLPKTQGLRRTYFALGATDREATPELCEEACRSLGIRRHMLRWFATGGHNPHLESAKDPEGTARNRHELVLLVDEALDEVSTSRHASPELAVTELATPESFYDGASDARARDSRPTPKSGDANTRSGPRIAPHAHTLPDVESNRRLG
jgi:hypothetical protein